MPTSFRKYGFSTSATGDESNDRYYTHLPSFDSYEVVTATA